MAEGVKRVKHRLSVIEREIKAYIEGQEELPFGDYTMEVLLFVFMNSVVFRVQNGVEMLGKEDSPKNVFERLSNIVFPLRLKRSVIKQMENTSILNAATLKELTELIYSE